MTWLDVFRRIGAEPRGARIMASYLDNKQEAAQQRLAEMVAANRAKPEIMAYPARRDAARRAAQTRRAQA
jgi:hypothetical protein